MTRSHPARHAALVAALVLLNVALTFGNRWPTLWIEPVWALSVELAAALALLAYAVGRFGPPSRRAIGWLAALTLVLVLGRYAAVTAGELYGRPINLYYDLPHVPAVVAMFVEVAPAWLLVAAPASAALGLVAVHRALRWAWGRIADSLCSGPVRRFVGFGALAACAAYLFAPGGFAEPVTAVYSRQVTLLADAFAGKGPHLGESPQFANGLERLGGADVYVVFVESYGATTYDHPAHAERLRAPREALAEAVAATSRGVVSAFVTSPTFGGGSWLAHSSLLTGLDVGENDAYNVLVTQRRETLVGAFARRGYRTVALMPGLQRAWREGAAFYGFDAVYDAQALGYQGPAFGWWRIPDQYAIAAMRKREAAVEPRQPRFVFFPTINSHAPFRPTPPYEPDWSRVATGEAYSAFAGLPVRTVAQRDWTNLEAAYGDAIAYSLEWLAGYLRERAGEDAVLVMLGDHQPPGGVTEANPSWDVPVHVITRRREVLDALVADGFTPGLAPQRPALGRTHDLTPILLRAFGSGGETRVHVPRPGTHG